VIIDLYGMRLVRMPFDGGQGLHVELKRPVPAEAHFFGYISRRLRRTEHAA